MKTIKPATDPKTGKALPYRLQPRDFQVSEAVKGITGFVLMDRSSLPLDQKVSHYVKIDGCSQHLNAEAQAEVAEKILTRLLTAVPEAEALKALTGKGLTRKMAEFLIADAKKYGSGAHLKAEVISAGELGFIVESI